MGLGFELSESMAGTYHRFDDPLTDHPMRITLRLAVDGLRRFARDRRIDAAGTIHAEGLTRSGEVRGTLTWKLLDQNRVPYALTFEGDDGKPYHLRGQRDFFFHNVVGSMTTLAASLYDGADVELGRAMLDVEPRLELPTLLRSFRPRLRVWGKAKK